jgi:hypothetical protein
MLLLASFAEILPVGRVLWPFYLKSTLSFIRQSVVPNERAVGSMET